MELDLKYISLEADVYDVRTAVALVLHGPDLYDPNDERYGGRVPNFEVRMGTSDAGRHHDRTAILRVTKEVGRRLLRWCWESDKNNIVVHGRVLKIFHSYRDVTPNVEETLKRGIYVDPERDQHRTLIERQAKLVWPRITQVQFGVWYKSLNFPSVRRRSFSIEYDRYFGPHDAAYVSVVYEYGLIQIDVSTMFFFTKLTKALYVSQIMRDETPRKYFIFVKFSNIRKLGLVYDDGQPPCEWYGVRTQCG
jgi:RNA-dependent RNA polymerase